MRKQNDGRDYRAFVRHLQGRTLKPQGYFLGYPHCFVGVPGEPVMQAAMGLYGCEPLVRIFVWSDRPPVGIPVNEELAFALALDVHIPPEREAEQVASLEKSAGHEMTDEIVQDRIAKAMAESQANVLPFAYFGYFSHAARPGEVQTAFWCRGNLPIGHTLRLFHMALTK